MDFERLFDSSYERVLNSKVNNQTFFEAFYDRFLKSDPRVAEHFKHTHMDQQQKMLEKSFYKLLVFYATNSSDEFLEQVAIRHSKLALNIQPELYDLWLEVLIDTVTDFDPQFDDSVELAWRLVLSTGITYMKFKYDH